ncbi:hypothetical protein TELCIR_16454 [Teladorsagia circumcincta]|uniref:Uncharacterized protein n=1 Tax=Teladorsagia circumcincta TaxID=45464 RepID=A0A2G9TVF1_TELCI|nr:hypothetical protein TELCIR_16454 [Teladorsagia circumcincta]
MDVYMRLVEYPRDGQVFRKWTYERIGEKVEPVTVHVPECPYLKTFPKVLDKNNENKEEYIAWGSYVSSF